jgi:hypothetical protein
MVILLGLCAIGAAVAVLMRWRMSSPTERVYADLCRLTKALQLYELEHGQLPPTLASLQRQPLSGGISPATWRGVVYTYWESDAFSADLPTGWPTNARVRFYYPLEDGRAWIGVGGGVATGKIRRRTDDGPSPGRSQTN